ncbi:MAG: hypothetical protein KGO96_06935 [Elusimicrobia bacterium]|nr:hypothetical protein [Elusimicrobiota bacterium]
MGKQAKTLSKRELRIREMMVSLSKSLDPFMSDRTIGNEEILVAMATMMVAVGSHLGFSSAKIIRSICNVYEPRKTKHKSKKGQPKKDNSEPLFIMAPPKDVQ